MSLWGLWFTEQEEYSLQAAYNGVRRSSRTPDSGEPAPAQPR
ncbi:hypothetical protein ABMA10_19715 [Plantibacter sp. RU18]